MMDWLSIINHSYSVIKYPLGSAVSFAEVSGEASELFRDAEAFPTTCVCGFGGKEFKSICHDGDD